MVNINVSNGVLPTGVNLGWTSAGGKIDGVAANVAKAIESELKDPFFNVLSIEKRKEPAVSQSETYDIKVKKEVVSEESARGANLIQLESLAKNFERSGISVNVKELSAESGLYIVTVNKR